MSIGIQQDNSKIILFLALCSVETVFYPGLCLSTGLQFSRLSILSRLRRPGSACQEKHGKAILQTCVQDTVSVSLLFNTSRKLASEQW